MSLYLCPEHGVTGPMACCEKAARATVELNGQRVSEMADIVLTNGQTLTTSSFSLFAPAGSQEMKPE